MVGTAQVRFCPPYDSEQGAGAGPETPAARSRNLRYDKDVARDWPDNVERAARGNNEDG